MNTTSEFFDSKAAIWDDDNTLSTPEKIARVLSAAGVRENDTVLDIGTGTGVLLPHIAELIGAGGSIMAVDISPKMLALAHHKFASLGSSIQFVLADAESDYIAGTYDRIFLYCIYPHLHYPIETLMRLAERNLRPGGTITIAHPMSRAFLNDVHRRVPVHSSDLPAASELTATLTAHGFTPLTTEETDEIYLVTLRK